MKQRYHANEDCETILVEKDPYCDMATINKTRMHPSLIFKELSFFTIDELLERKKVTDVNIPLTYSYGEPNCFHKHNFFKIHVRIIVPAFVVNLSVNNQFQYKES
jgi:hypothetical protein